MKYYGTYKEVTEKLDGALRILNGKVYEYSMLETVLVAMAYDFRDIVNTTVEYGACDIFENSITVRAGDKSYIIYAEQIS